EDDVERLLVGCLFPQLDQPRQGCRANVAAARETEIDGVGLALQRLAGKSLAVGADQRERSAEIRLGGGTLRWAFWQVSRQQERRKPNEGERDQCPQDQANARHWRALHRSFVAMDNRTP